MNIDPATTGAAAAPGLDALRDEAARLVRTGALGRSQKIGQLFAYLLDRSLKGRPPKEIEVAMDVFGRGSDFEPAQDATVRVYAHKLRQRLAAVYAAAPDHPGPRVTIPRGEYRLTAEPAREAEVEALAAPTPSIAPPRLVAAALLLMTLASLATWAVVRAPSTPAAREMARLRQGPVWGPLLNNGLPTVVVLGDYYIFGESENGMEVNRLVREYTVNSREDLSDYLTAHPDKAFKYLDLDLRYLPIGAASALRDVAPVLGDGRARDAVKVVMMSELTPAMLKASNVVYVGYLSGMGWLRDVALQPSRFALGETFDDIIDRRTRAHYASGGGRAEQGGAIYRDYGYVSTFNGPGKGRLVVIAGTRDVALMQAAEDATRAGSVAEAARRSGGAAAFEALYEVEGMNRQNVGARLLTASPLDTRRLWAGGPAARVPAPAG